MSMDLFPPDTPLAPVESLIVSAAQTHDDRFLRLAEAWPEPIVVYDEKERPLFVNRSMAAIWPSDQRISPQVADDEGHLLAPGTRPSQLALRSGVPALAIPVRLAWLGGERWIASAYPILDRERRPLRVLVILRRDKPAAADRAG